MGVSLLGKCGIRDINTYNISFKKMKMRKSQQQIFWKDHKIIEVRNKGRFVMWISKRFPVKEAQEIVDGG